MKRCLAFFLGGLLLPCCLIGISYAQGFWENDKFYYNASPVDGDQRGISSENLGVLAAEGMAKSNQSLLNSFLNMFGFGGSEYDGQVPKAIIYLKFIINLLLSLVSFIALVVIIYAFYMMFFTEDAKGIEKVKKSLTGVVIALVIMGLSRLIVSFIFDFYDSRLLNPT